MRRGWFNTASAVHTVQMCFKFLLLGIPGFVITAAANFILVQYVEMNKTMAYLLVVFTKTSFNYFVCRKYMLQCEYNNLWHVTYFLFVPGILVIRAADLIVYSFLVYRLTIYFIFAQIHNVMWFSGIKYFVAKYVFQKTVKNL